MKKATGIVRKTDELGRIVLPMELRRALGIKEGTPMEILVGNDGEIILNKYNPGCISCGCIDNLKYLPGGEAVCEQCLKEVK